MNAAHILMPTLRIPDVSLAQRVCKCILHTLIYLRSMGPTKSIQEQLDGLDITYSRCDHVDFCRAVDAAVEQLPTTASTDVKRSATIFKVSFSERVVSNAFIFRRESLLPWELWTLPIEIASSNWTRTTTEERQEAFACLERELRFYMALMASVADANQHYIPPLTTRDRVPFPCDIKVQPAVEPVLAVDTVVEALAQTLRPAFFTCSTTPRSSSMSGSSYSQ